MILSKVKESTKAHHDFMEELIGSHRLADFSLMDYQLLVATNYGFHSSLEQALCHSLTPAQQTQVSFTNRKKAEALASELRALGLLPDSLHPPMVVLDSFAYALGWMYVAEGSMLGGKYIHKVLLKNDRVAQKATFGLYTLYGEHTGRLWKEFKQLVEEQVVEVAQEEEFLRGAEDAYQVFAACHVEAKKQFEAPVLN